MPKITKETEGITFFIQGILYEDELVLEIHEGHNFFKLNISQNQFNEEF